MLNRMLWEGAYPALVTKADGTIVGLNTKAAELLGVGAEQVLGAPCHEVLCGRDPFGNRFCSPLCALRVLHERREPARDFVLQIEAKGGSTVRARVSALFVYQGSAEDHLIIHVFAATGDGVDARLDV